MRFSFISVFLSFVLVGACAVQPRVPAGQAASTGATGGSMHITVTINGAHTFAATLAQNESARAFAALLADGALTLSLHGYGGFEQVGALPARLPRNDTRIAAAPGDIMLYQGDQLVMFYGTNEWSYSRLGRIDGTDKDALAAVLGAGDVTATFALSD